MRRIKLFAAASAISAVAAVGVAAVPAEAATTVIGTPPGALVSLCLTIRPNPPVLCIYI